MTVKQEGKSGKIRDLLTGIKERILPLVSEEATVDEIINAYSRSSHSRLVYVVDKEKRLTGIISLGSLLRHVFFHYHKDCIDTRNLISMAVSDQARDFIEKEPVMARLSEDVKIVLQRMIRHNIKEIPVVDEKMRVIADLTMVDILQHSQGEAGL